MFGFICILSVSSYMSPNTESTLTVNATPAPTPRKNNVTKPKPAPSLMLSVPDAFPLTVGEPAIVIKFRLSDGTAASNVSCNIPGKEFISATAGDTGMVLRAIKETDDPIIIACKSNNGNVDIYITKVYTKAKPLIEDGAKSTELFETNPTPIQPKGLEVSEDVLKITLQNGEARTLKQSLVPEDAADGISSPTSLRLAKDEVIRVNIPGCDNGISFENADHTKRKTTWKCFELVSSSPENVAVIGGNTLIGTSKKGAADITIRSVTKSEILNLSNGFKEVLPLVVNPVSTIFTFPLTKDEKVEKLKVQIEQNTDLKIVSVPRIKSYNDVKDQYGKGIAGRFLVVTVDINNSNSAKQFLVQNVSIKFDPAQCNKIALNWQHIVNDYKGIFKEEYKNTTSEAIRSTCFDKYKEYFHFPVDLMPSDGSTLLAIDTAEKYRSWRYWTFKGARFAADVGSGLSIFKILGRDGKTGFNFLGSTLFTASEVLWPNVSEEKRKNLENDIPKSNVIVKGTDSAKVNLFIPINHVFTTSGWKSYKRKLKTATNDALFDQYMILFLVANSNGILIDENSRQVESKQGGGVKITQ